MTQTPPANPSDVDLCVAIAKEAGQATLSWFNKRSYSIEQKADGSPVTAADLAIETLIRERLAEAYPSDSVLGEEHPESSGNTDREWIIDPIDGTRAFIKGVPLFANLIALVDAHGPAVGVINLPALNETVWAGRGLGTHFNGASCQVNNHAGLTNAFVCTSGFSYWPDIPFQAMVGSGIRLRTWGDAYGYALVATGRAEAMIDPEAFAWDLAPIATIISEAGGTFTNFDGASGTNTWRCGSAIASNGVVHQDLLALLA